MEHLIDKYLKKPEVVKELFQKEVSISLKVDGAAFQISCENGNVTYHKRGGSSKSLGPIIDEYTQLMRKNVNDAIKYFEPKKDILNKYKFYAIEMFNNSYILLTVIDNNDNIIDEPNKLKEIAKSLDIDCVPILFNGVLKSEQIDALISMMTLASETTNDVYKKYLTDIFGKGEYEKFLNGDEVEGIVLTWNLEDKIQQFKIINPAFKTRHDKEIKDGNEALKKEIEELTELYEFLYEQLEKYGTYKSDNWIENLNQNFLEIIDKEYSKIKEFDKTIQPKFKDFFTLQPDRVSKDIKELIDKYGDHMKFYYEKYLSLFNKPKKRNFTISKEFQIKVNNLIEKLQSKNENLRIYTINNMKSLGNYIIERGPAPIKYFDKNPAVMMVQTIIDELTKKNDCKYDKEKNEYVGKDADLWKGAGQFLFDYMQTLDQKDFKAIVDNFGWEQYIPDINDIHPAEISMCVSLFLNTNKNNKDN